jgi:hypothetical protein
MARRWVLAACSVAVVAAIATGTFVAFQQRASTSEGSLRALEALRTDPLAARTHPGATLSFVEDRSHKGPDLVTGKPTTTQLLRSFTPIAGSTSSLLNRLRAEALAAGWFPEPNALPSEVRATKGFSFGLGQLVITIDDRANPASVVIALTPSNPDL